MDHESLRRLEFDKVREMLAMQARSAGGAERARRLVPSSIRPQVEAWLAQTAEAVELLRVRDTGFLGQVHDVGPSLRVAAAGGVLGPEALRDVGQVLRACRLARECTREERYAQLRAVVASLPCLPELEQEISQAIDEGGWVKDEASPELRAVRRRISAARARLKDSLREFVRSPAHQKYLQDAIVTERGGRYVVPVKQECRAEVPGIIHDESASGATVFVEPLAAVQANNEIRRLESEERREVERVLRRLTGRLAPWGEEIRAGVGALHEFDFILARGSLALAMDGRQPLLNERKWVRLPRARHPLLGKEAVPIDIEVGRDFDILIITGPNTGGKTVALKTLGLLTVMGMSGLFLPAAEGCQICLFDAVLADIGDEQSIEQSLSTFSSHMGTIVEILRRATSDSLVLLDELGAGTDPVEGASLARAILEELLNRGLRAVVTTHQSELKVFASQHARAENASVEFDPVSLRPTFRLIIGVPGSSNALEIAARLGLEARLVERARELLPRQEVELGRVIAQLRETTEAAERERTRWEQLRREVELLQAALASQREALERERREVLERTRSDARQYLARLRAEADEAVEQIRRLLREREQPPRWHEVEQARRGLGRLSVDLPQPPPAVPASAEDLRPGSPVEIRSIGQRGHVITAPNAQGEVLVQVGIVKLTVRAEDLAPAAEQERERARARTQTFLDKARTTSPELDLRGLHAEDALHELDRYLSDARLAGLTSVRIIHGKGTGALRRAVREYLEKAGVQEFRDGERGEGGSGVTVVLL
ncbi:MAG: endonuclease MutS2 [Syntrophomonadaceae bacterium]|jgi:DNA mismatch repair protein MutS2|nr:endonuclease MutS2 [Syntrophomonadaceae bacterium]MDH7496847.1 endonuclease MutS2 [Syntrophomonadaceae bacterium]